MDGTTQSAAAAPVTLSRTLERRHVTMISIGGIIGAGLFVGTSAAIVAAGPAAALSYAGAGLLMLLIMRMLGEMAVALPQVRSFTEFTRAGLGAGAGFVAGWLYWYFWVVVIPVEAIAGSNLLHHWLPAVPTWEIGLVLMATMTAVNLMSAKSYGEFEFWFASIKVAAIVAFIAVTASYAFGFTSPTGSTFGNLTSHGGFAPHSLVAALAVIATAFFAMTGAEITTIAAAESKEPGRAIAQMSRSVVVRILAFYVCSLILIVSVVPWTEVKAGESPFTLAMVTVGLHGASKIMSFIILTAVLSCLNSSFYVCSRVLFVLAEHRDAPQWLVKLNVRAVPTRSVLIGAIAGVLGILANSASPDGLFAFLVNAAGALILFIYIMTALAQIRLRRARQRAGQSEAELSMWWFPWASYFAIAGMVTVLVAMMMDPDLASQLYVSLIPLAAAVLAYGFLRQWRNRQPAAKAGQ